MKRITLVIVLIVVIGGIIVAYNKFPMKETYTQPEKEVVTETVEVSQLNKRIQDAQAEATPRLQEAAQAAYDAAMTKGLTEIELEVRRAYRIELEAQEAALEEQVSF